MILGKPFPQPHEPILEDAGIPYVVPSMHAPKSRKIDAELCLICALNRLKLKAVTFTPIEVQAATNQTLKVTPDDGAYHVITNGMGS